MNLFSAKIVVALAITALFTIRLVYALSSMKRPVVKNQRGLREWILLVIAKSLSLLPIFWLVSPFLAFADYPLHSVPFVAGIPCYILGLWLFYRSHSDLGVQFSETLELKENHVLITEGIYSRLRHPMYLSFLIYSVGQALVLPNYIAAPSFGLAMVLLLAIRLGREEEMLREEFGSEYDAYCERSYRLIPGVW